MIKEIVSRTECYELLRENDWIYSVIAKAFAEECNSFHYRQKDFLLQMKYLF